MGEFDIDPFYNANRQLVIGCYQYQPSMPHYGAASSQASWAQVPPHSHPLGSYIHPSSAGTEVVTCLLYALHPGRPVTLTNSECTDTRHAPPS